MNPPVSKVCPLVLDTVSHVSNYDFINTDFDNISNSGYFSPGTVLNQGKIVWDSLDSSVSQVTYNFSRQYDQWGRDNDGKSNQVYFSGTVIQPFSSEVAGGDVTAKYVDTDGNIISEDVVKSGNIGEDYSTDQLDIPGYTFKEVQGAASGKFTDTAQTVTYGYTKDTVDPVTPEPKQDDNSNQDNNDNNSTFSSASSSQNLPETGESDGIGWMSAGLLLLATALFTSVFRLKKTKKIKSYDFSRK